MEKLFVPYVNNEPACININGHRLVLLALDAGAFSGVQSFEADTIQELDCETQEIDLALENLQEQTKGGIVVMPHDIDPDDLIETLKDELPWVH